MPASQKENLIYFDPEKCTQCHGCEIACKSWRSLAYGVRYRRVLNLWQGEFPGVKSKTLSLACLHCVQPECAAACPEEAISKSEIKGLVIVDETICSGCGICADACPYGVPQFDQNGLMQKCDLCNSQQLAQAPPPCVDTCPGDALLFAELSQEEKKVHGNEIMRLLRAIQHPAETIDSA